MKKYLEHYLEDEPKARERKNKNRALANAVIRIHGLEVTKEKMTEVVSAILHGDRMWRKILEERPELRGSDYGDKEILEQEKQIELGYEPGANRKLKL